MTKMNQFEFTSKNQALSAIRKELFAYQNDSIVGESIKKMEAELQKKESDDKLKIAVCGQYSAGKSTLVHALTNDDTIAIGQDVTTDAVKCYEWQGMQIADTPGIYAGREEHDALSLDFIQKADLLIYMITIQGFTREIGANFKNLVLEKYADKTMLVMNKRNQEPAENEKNWRNDTSLFLGGDEMLKKFYFSIVDIEDYLTGEKEDIPELVSESHFTDFLNNLNAFVKNRELMGRVVSKVNIVDAVLSMYISDFSNAPEKDNFTKRQKTAVQRAINSVNKIISNEAIRMRQDVKALKQKLAGLLTDETIQEFKLASDNAEVEMQQILDSSQMVAQFENVLSTLNQEMEEVEQDALAYDGRISSLAQNYARVDISSAVDMSGFMSGLEGVSKALSMVSKEGLIKFVHFFGGKFKPWGATKCMKWVKAAGPILSVIGSIMDFVQLAKDKQHQQELQDARNDIISSFGEIETGILPQLEEIKNAEGSIGQILNGLLNSLNEREQKQQELCQHKEQLLKEFKRIKAELDEII